MVKRLSKETLEKIREEIKNGKSKYQTAKEYELHPTVVYRWTQDQLVKLKMELDKRIMDGWKK